MDARLQEINVDAIDVNPENPRQIFHDSQDERLANSIDEKGILVPLYVYESEEKDRFILIDGERRWTQANRLGLEIVPALVRNDKPDDAENIVEMFNIHLVRAQWDDMPTALALQKVIERTGLEDLDELKRLTGLSKEKIKDFRLILELPERYQDLIREQKIPMNLFVEIEENVIRPLARQRPKLWATLSADGVRDSFLAKRDAGSLTDIVELRKMRPIIKQAAEEAGDPEEDSALDDVVKELIEDVDTSIEDSYTEFALASVELGQLSKKVGALVTAVDRLIAVTEESAEDRDQLKDVLEGAITELQSRANTLD
jgi:ParB/RepB/Spo0J family partition protein